MCAFGNIDKYYIKGHLSNMHFIYRKNVYAVFSAISFDYAIVEEFNEKICSKWNDTTDCKTKVNDWGPYIFSTIYNEQTADFFCTELDPDCEASQVIIFRLLHFIDGLIDSSYRIQRSLYSQ